jgi:predicted P-loop ATPase
METSGEVQKYLKSLKWDGVDWRIDALALQFGGKPADDAQALYDFFDNAVRRAHEPGCRVDRMLVLVGEPGSGKTRFLRALAGRWYGASAGARLPSDAWIQEVAYSTRTRDDVKLYVTAVQDVYRPPYGRQLVTRLRSHVHVVTTSSLSIAATLERSRYYRVLRVTEPVKLDDRLRDQLWAYAYKRYIDRARTAA